jgi:hypothetical protein
VTAPTPNAPGTNTGHGHVWERPDGRKARCGGPGLCSQCSTDAARAQRPDGGEGGNPTGGETP